MKEIVELNSDAKQEHVLLGENGEEITISLEYKDNQIGWFLSLEYLDITINSIRLTSSADILYKWKNLFPFGISVTSIDKGDPYNLNDFTSGRIRFFLLTEEDKESFYEQFYGE